MNDVEREVMAKGMLLMRWMELMNAMYRLIREVDPNATLLPYRPRLNTPLHIAYDIAELLGKGLRPE